MGTQGKVFTRKTKAPAVGIANGLRRVITVGFTPDKFDRISALAQTNGISFREQVCRLCAVALKRKEYK